jgi:hypothetical protein
MTSDQNKIRKPLTPAVVNGDFEDGGTARYNAERAALEALDGEIGSAYCAEMSPPLDELADLLAKHGWIYDPEPANPNSQPDA